MAQPLSLRFTPETIEQLGARARRAGLPARTLAQPYVEEGLRMDEHPLVRFLNGPAGRRAALVGAGPDVWKLVIVIRDNDGDFSAAAEYLELPLGLVQAGAAYYGAYRSEIDDWIAASEHERADAHAAFGAARAAFGR